MNDTTPFVDAILAATGDEQTRLVFADWLEERGDPRAGCLRLAARLRAGYGPRRHDHSASFWKSIGRDIEPAWWAEEAGRLAAEMDDKVGDGRKTAILLALALTEGALLFPGFADADLLTRDAENAVAGIVQQITMPRSIDDFALCLRTATLGDEEIAEGMLSAFHQAGRDGSIEVKSATRPGQPKVSVTREEQMTVEVCGASSEETEQLDALACGALHAGRAAIAYGCVPGAGVAYLHALGPRKRELSPLFAWALEEPTRALLGSARMDIVGSIAMLRRDSTLGLDVLQNALVPRQWPCDPVRVARTALECAVASAARAHVAGVWLGKP